MIIEQVALNKENLVCHNKVNEKADDYWLRLKILGENSGIDLMGIADISPYHQELEQIGGALIHHYPRAISIGIVLQNSIVNLLSNRESFENVFQYRTHAYDIINQRLDHFASILASVIQKSGFRVMPVPAAERIDSQRICASISHKAVARLAGFGWIGKNCLLITPKYGPRVRWTSVLTDAPLAVNKEFVPNRCGTCQECVKACPARAIKGKNFVEGEPRDNRLDVEKCQQYYQSLSGSDRLAVCGMCLYACPHGKQS